MVLMAEGVPEAEAQYVAWHLVQANLRGTDSHGIARLPHYVRRLKLGSIVARPNITFQQQGPAVGTVDGDHGLGHLVMRRATEEAGRLADEACAGWVAVRNSSHCGALAPFGLQLAARQMMGIVFTHVDPMVLPFGSTQPFSGTNPICLTTPGAGGKTFCLDMATSVVPWNRVENAANEGISIPDGWGVDRAGNPTTDPKKVNALYPFSTYKGSGLGILIDVFCSMLTGSPFGPEVPKMYGDLSKPRRLGGLVGAIKIAPFIDAAAFERRVGEMAAQLGAMPTISGVDRVRFPGEPEIETQTLREKQGVPVGLRTFKELNALAVSAGLDPLIPKSNATGDGTQPLDSKRV
jgi:ureidoglycolate dehydrogenase (NAD+)